MQRHSLVTVQSRVKMIKTAAANNPNGINGALARCDDRGGRASPATLP
jgi:hypothetical protein